MVHGPRCQRVCAMSNVSAHLPRADLSPLPPLRRHFARRRAWDRFRREAERGFPDAHRRFEEKHGYSPDFGAPRTHSERVWARKLSDRNPVYTTLVDKMKARSFVVERIGAERAAAVFPPLLCETRRTAGLPRRFQEDVYVKAAHLCGANLPLAAGQEVRDHRDLLSDWMGRVHGHWLHEIAYFDAPARLIVERRLPIISDLKLYAYDGKVRWLMPEDNAGPRPGIAFFDRTGTQLALVCPDFESRDLPLPDGVDEMIELAERISAGFDMMRVDFLVTADRFYLGEVTPYDGSGQAHWANREMDLLFAQYWRQLRFG